MLASHRFHSVVQLRVGPGALIILVHLVFYAILVRHAGTPTTRGETPPADYITFVLVPATATPKQAQAPVAPPPVPRTRRVPPQQPEPAQSAPDHVPAVPASQGAAPEQAAPEGDRLDMEALRAAARRVAQERAPTVRERLREAEQMRSEDDTDLARAIKRAKRPDCRTAYAGGDQANILMLVPLLIDTVRDKGCKW